MLLSSSFPSEVLLFICKQLSSERRTLACLARTCKMFEEPALDVLWSEIGGFYPLVKCLPADALQMENGNILTLKRPLTKLDCSRFLYYARKVHHYENARERSYLDREWPRINKVVYTLLNLLLDGSKLLPNLRHLSWDFQVGSFEILHMFLGPHVTKFTLKFSHDLTTSLSFIPILRDIYPSLREITFINIPQYNARYSAGNSQHWQVIGMISDTVPAWKKLQFLKVANLTYSGLREVAKLPQLTRLELEECHFDSVAIQENPSDGGFPALTHLVLRKCLTASDCVVVLKTMKNSPVVVMDLGIHAIEASAAWQDIMLAINEHCNHETLRALSCKDQVDNFDKHREVLDNMISFEAIRSLFVFSNLRSIDLLLTKGYDLPDAAAVLQMALSWPKIRCLNLGIHHGSILYDFPVISLFDLIPFAEHCPELEELTILFNAFIDLRGKPEETEKVIKPKRYDTRLQTLNVTISPIGTPGIVAANLSGIFPGLKTIMSMSGTYSNSSGDGWKQVEELVKLFTIVGDLGWSS